MLTAAWPKGFPITHPFPLTCTVLTYPPFQLLATFDRRGIKRMWAYKLWRKVIQGGVTEVEDILGMPKAVYEIIRDEFKLVTSKVVKSTVSKDGSTTKMLVELQDGKLVESVIMRYGHVEFSTHPNQVTLTFSCSGR